MTYAVSTDLKELFSSAGGEGFTFLSEDQEPNEVAEEQSFEEQPCTESTPSSEQAAETFRDDCARKFFFFHSKNEALRNRLEENTFYRRKSLEELEVGWPARRSAMKESFKRRHKDAVRFSRKGRRRQTTEGNEAAKR